MYVDISWAYFLRRLLGPPIAVCMYGDEPSHIAPDFCHFCFSRLYLRVSPSHTLRHPGSVLNVCQDRPLAPKTYLSTLTMWGHLDTLDPFGPYY